jgi:multicomponent Na+:H+ antiporter subunit E
VNAILITIVLALVWTAATGALTLPNLLLGAVVAGAAIALIRGHVRFGSGARRARRIISLFLLFLYELFASAVRVGLLALRPNLDEALAPGIVAVPLRLTNDAEITLLANMITLTPGTLTVDVSEDRSTIYVHALVVRDREALTRSIAGGFEQKVIEAFE